MTMPSEPSAAFCAELLLAYQGVVVHDLRGDLNGLLLTVDFLRRQLATRPDIASMFGETLGDLDHVRVSLNKTLNQLDMVGHARRSISQQTAGELAAQNLSDVVNDTLRNHLAERARRRRVVFRPPPPSDLAVKADPILLQLAIQRLLFAMTDLGRDTELNLAIEPSGADKCRLRVWLSDPSSITDDLVSRAMGRSTGENKPGPISALALSMRLAEWLGGSLRRDDAERAGFCLELPLANPSDTAKGGSNASAL